MAVVAVQCPGQAVRFRPREARPRQVGPQWQPAEDRVALCLTGRGEGRLNPTRASLRAEAIPRRMQAARPGARVVVPGALELVGEAPEARSPIPEWQEMEISLCPGHSRPRPS